MKSSRSRPDDNIAYQQDDLAALARYQEAARARDDSLGGHE